MSYMSFTDYLSHYSYKYLFQWSCGTFETDLANNLIDNPADSPVGFYYETPLQKFITGNGIVYSSVNMLCYIMWYLFVMVISVSMVKDILQRRIDLKMLLFQIIVLGFIGFYIIMETSPHYLFIVLPFVIMIFARSFCRLINGNDSVSIS